MDNNNMDIDQDIINIDSDEDVILEEEEKKSVSFSSNEDSIGNMVAKAVSDQVSYKIEQEIMNSPTRLSNEVLETVATDSEDECTELGKNNKDVKHMKSKHSWSLETDEEETPEDEEVAKLIRKRRVDSNAYSPKKSNHANKVAVSPSPRKNRMSTNPYKVTTPAPKRHTKPLTLDDKEKERSQQTIEKYNEIKRSYLKAAVRIERQEIPNGSKVRVKFQFTPGYGANDPREVLGNLFEHLKVIDQKAQILPWNEDYNNHLGPIRMADLTNDWAVSKLDLKFYIDAPQSMIRDGYTQGLRIWNMQVHINTTIEADRFKAVWSSKKLKIINSELKFTSITMSCIQDAPKAFLIGIAQGSTEGMNEMLINSRLETIVGVPGIRVSYQTIHQPGITKQLWDNANRKAKSTRAAPNSRGFLDKKYAWAPEGLGVYVSNDDIADIARKKMMSMYGITNEHGVPPVWPGGECMRFIPLKDTYIYNSDTRTKVDRRFKLHVYLKANERVIITKFRNINEKIQDEMTFQEYVLGINSTEVENFQLFRHFKKLWSKDPMETVWALSVHKSLLPEAEKVAITLEENLREKFGDAVMDTFIAPQMRRNPYCPTTKQNTNDDDWFDEEDDDTDILYKKVIIVEGYKNLFSDTGYASENVPEWDMTSKKSVETEFSVENVEQKESTAGTDVSSLTNSVGKDDIKQRTDTIAGVLQATYKFKPDEVRCVQNSIHPFQIFKIIISAPSFNILDTVHIICALRKSFQDNPYQDSKMPPPPMTDAPLPPPPESDGIESDEDII